MASTGESEGGGDEFWTVFGLWAVFLCECPWEILGTPNTSPHRKSPCHSQDVDGHGQ